MFIKTILNFKILSHIYIKVMIKINIHINKCNLKNQFYLENT